MPLNPSPVFLFKPVYQLIDEPLVDGIWSSSFQHIGGLKLLSILLLQENDELDPKDLNLRMIIDGVEYNSATPQTFINNTAQGLYFADNVDDIYTSEVQTMPYQDDIGNQIPLECSSLQFLLGLDSVAGTNQRYTLIIRWLGAS